MTPRTRNTKAVKFLNNKSGTHTAVFLSEFVLQGQVLRGLISEKLTVVIMTSGTKVLNELRSGLHIPLYCKTHKNP